MEFPIRKKFVVPIYDKYGGIKTHVATISFEEPFAYDVLLLNTKKKQEIYSWVVDLINENTEIIYPKFQPTNIVEKLLWFIVKKKRKYGFQKYARQVINKGMGKICEKIVEKYFSRNESIFSDITYPRLKGEKGRRRPSTSLESLIRVCNGRGDRVQQLLKTHTFSQVVSILDAKQLSSNESVVDYQRINDLALSKGPEGTKRKEEQEEIMKQMEKLYKAKREGRVKTVYN